MCPGQVQSRNHAWTPSYVREDTVYMDDEIPRIFGNFNGAGARSLQKNPASNILNEPPIYMLRRTQQREFSWAWCWNVRSRDETGLYGKEENDREDSPWTNKVGPPRVMTGLTRGPTLIAFYLFLIFIQAKSITQTDGVRRQHPGPRRLLPSSVIIHLNSSFDYFFYFTAFCLYARFINSALTFD